MPTLQLQKPVALGALAFVIVLGLLWWRACRRAGSSRKSLPDGKDEDLQTRLRRADALRGALRIGALAAVIVGLAGPEAFRLGALSGAHLDRVPVVFVLDVSASMEGTDVQPDRLTSAKNAIARICSLLPGARTALVAVAEDTAVACPLTGDTHAFLDILSQMRTNWMGAGGTRLSGGVQKARTLIARDGSRGVVVIVSDGEDHGEPVEPLLRQMERDGVITNTLVVGSPGGATLEALPVAGTSEPVVTKANPERMAAWAALGGGRAWSVTPAGSSLPSRAEDVVPLAALKEAAREAGDATFLAPYFYLLAAMLLLADLLLRA